MELPKNRLSLHEILCNVLGTRNCYYSPPTGKQMKYPCIVYELGGIRTYHADNTPYKDAKRYTITLIDENPDSEFFEPIKNLPYCGFDRAFSSENLNHFVFTMYY